MAGTLHKAPRQTAAVVSIEDAGRQRTGGEAAVDDDEVVDGGVTVGRRAGGSRRLADRLDKALEGTACEGEGVCCAAGVGAQVAHDTEAQRVVCLEVGAEEDPCSAAQSSVRETQG